MIQFVEENRQRFVPQLFLSNPKVSSLLQNEAALMVTILNPKSYLLPDDIRSDTTGTLVQISTHCRGTMCTMYTTNI